jgi:hypothetical protein
VVKFCGPYNHVVVDVSITKSAHEFHCSSCEGSAPATLQPCVDLDLDADIRTSSSIGTPYFRNVYACYPSTLEDGGRLAPLPA